MRIHTFTAAFLLLSASAYAQKPPEAWACQGTNKHGYKWENGTWSPTSFYPNNYLLKMAGAGSSYSYNGKTRPITCKNQAPNEIVCITDIVATTIALNTSTGMGGLSNMFGFIDVGDVRDGVSLTILQCTRM